MVFSLMEYRWLISRAGLTELWILWRSTSCKKCYGRIDPHSWTSSMSRVSQDSIEQWFTRGHWTKSGDSFLFRNQWRQATGYWWLEAMDSTKDPTMYRTIPHAHKEWSGPKCPWCWGWETLTYSDYVTAVSRSSSLAHGNKSWVLVTWSLKKHLLLQI